MIVRYDVDQWGDCPYVCGVGGTIRNVDRLNSYFYDLSKNNRFVIADNLNWMVKKLENRENKKLVPRETLETLLKVVPERVRTIMPGMIILNTIVKYFNVQSIYVSRAGVREGYLYKQVLTKRENRMHKKIDTSYTQNRELSWLRFDDRVLEEAIDENVPLYERLKFIAIYASNLDEFYRVRVGSLYEMASVDTNGFDNKSFMTPSQQLDKIFVATKQLNQKADKIFATVEKQLKTYGIERKKVKSLNQKDKTYVKTYFDNQISPFLSPQIINVRHPFPHLLNKALYVGIILTRKKKKVFGIIPVPSNLLKSYIYQINLKFAM